jgi:hypothetical protein
VKKDEKLPATAVTMKIAQTSSPTSTAFPADVNGFRIAEDTVRSCTAVK